MKKTERTIEDMTRAEILAVPYREAWNQRVLCHSIIIVPSEVSPWAMRLYRLRAWLAKISPWLKTPDIWEVSGMHDSGFRCMDFVAVEGDKPICRLSGYSDVVHIEGIGGLGDHWLDRYGTVPRMVPPRDWSIDCLPKSGLLRLFSGRAGIVCDAALSSFEIYSQEPKEPTDGSED